MKQKLILMALFCTQFTFAESRKPGDLVADVQVTAAVIRGKGDSVNQDAQATLVAAAKSRPLVKVVTFTKEENQEYRKGITSSSNEPLNDYDYFWVYGYKWTVSKVQPDLSLAEVASADSWSDISNFDTNQSQIEAKLDQFIQGINAQKEEALSETKKMIAAGPASASSIASPAAPSRSGSNQNRTVEYIESPCKANDEFKAAAAASKVVVVYYGSNTCTPCKALEPHLAAMEKKYASKGLKLITYKGSQDTRVFELQKFGHGTPSVRIWKDGKIVAKFDGGSAELYSIDSWIEERFLK